LTGPEPPPAPSRRGLRRWVVALAAGKDLAGVLACGQRPGDPLGRTDAQLRFTAL